MAALEYCSLPVKISDVPIVNDEISIFVKCHDRMFSKVTVLDDNHQELFTGTGPGASKSWSWRRQVTDASGAPVFTLRHHGWAMKNLWTIEGTEGHQIAELKHVNHGPPGQKSNFDMVVANPKEGGGPINLRIRQKDHSAITTQVFFMDSCIAEVLLQESNDISDNTKVDRSSWRVRIAGGVDPAIVLMIALCRAERHHMLWQ
ncbi:hypothetical protein DE146DRAFT_627793 [Phaeosphaeria sp. MPI-PUGE-AT-0046c]|nr:hypothetical protein DE146DRAFT_627793 [Phaeosphaeria sp. MPI-PUGE-AT-0046c]